MKYFSRVSGWIFVLGLVGLGLIARSGTLADPTDDFSFAISQAPNVDGFRLMPEKRVVMILRDRLRSFPDEQIPDLAKHLLKLCRKYRFDPAFILSLIEVESSFRVHAVSPAGAVGLMQLMPATAAWVAREFKMDYREEGALRDPFTNLSIGIAYLSVLRERYREVSPYFHIAAYNLGPARLDELRARPDFRPEATKVYYEKIRKNVPDLRFYERKKRT